VNLWKADGVNDQVPKRSFDGGLNWSNMQKNLGCVLDYAYTGLEVWQVGDNGIESACAAAAAEFVMVVGLASGFAAILLNESASRLERAGR